jgi:hypothetical protein
MRVRAFFATGVALAVSTVIAGCGGGSDAAVGTSSIVPTVTTTVTTAAPTTTRGAVTGTRSAPTSRTAGGGSAAVAASSFRADLTVQRAGLGLLALTNTAEQAVTVRGWPTLTFLNAANETVSVPVRKVSVPGAGPSITIGPGETAFAGVQWTVGDKADPKTFVATTVRMTPPGGTGWVNVNVIGTDGQDAGYAEFDITSARIGTLQPSSQGVLVF